MDASPRPHRCPSSRCAGHCAAPAPRPLLRPRLRLPPRLLARLPERLAARSLLSALGAQRQLRGWRAALRLLSAADLDAGRGAGAHSALDAGPGRSDLSAAGRHGAGHPRAGPAVARRRPRHAGRLRRALLRLCALHRLRAHRLRRAGRRLLDSAAAALCACATRNRCGPAWQARAGRLRSPAGAGRRRRLALECPRSA